MAKYRTLKGATPSTRKRKTDASVPMNKAGWNSLISESLEERVGDVARGVGGVQALQLPPHRMKSLSKRPRKYKTPKPKK